MGTNPTDWMQHAACREHPTDLFFPERGATPHDLATARAICATCPVLDHCAAYASQFTRLQGVWAGTTPKQRRPGYQPTPPRPRAQPATKPPKPPRPPRNQRTCAYPACGRSVHSRDLCNAHLLQQRRGTPLHPIRRACAYPGCRRKLYARSYCQPHYYQNAKGKELAPITRTYTTNPPETCTYPGCTRDHAAKDYCRGHYNQHRLGRPLTPLPTTGATP